MDGGVRGPLQQVGQEPIVEHTIAATPHKQQWNIEIREIVRRLLKRVPGNVCLGKRNVGNKFGYCCTAIRRPIRSTKRCTMLLFRHCCRPVHKQGTTPTGKINKPACG
jgi:hypothetical protein